MYKKEIVALLLAGGQGTRLDPLTRNISKPALPFGGENRIIDFTLSNCINSGIDTIGVLVQYKPFILNSHLKQSYITKVDNGGGITVLPPYSSSNGMSWYKGTAHAVYQNFEFLNHYNPEDVIILSGDHIYKMDYSKMINFHKKRDADITIGVVQVPMSEASRFGILNTDNKNKIIEFEEKPKNPRSDFASMGIYVCKLGILKKYLSDHEESSDFGKHILPAMLRDNLTLYAYKYSGYWRDIGIIDTYWEAHMDLLKKERSDLLYDKNWPIYSANTNIVLPQYISKQAIIKNSLISSGASIHGTINNSVIFNNTYISSGAQIKNSIILPGVEVGKNTLIEKSIISNDNIIGDNCKIGVYKSGKKNEVTVLGENCNILDGTIISNGRRINDAENYYSEDEANYA
ncbi:glucose-1-phosphate adenylyltransferase [Natronospora cellulosivora (SeqCode)]